MLSLYLYALKSLKYYHYVFLILKRNLSGNYETLLHFLLSDMEQVQFFRRLLIALLRLSISRVYSELSIFFFIELSILIKIYLIYFQIYWLKVTHPVFVILFHLSCHLAFILILIVHFSSRFQKLDRNGYILVIFQKTNFCFDLSILLFLSSNSVSSCLSGVVSSFF